MTLPGRRDRHRSERSPSEPARDHEHGELERRIAAGRRPATVVLAIILALSATGAQAARHDHHRGRHARRHAGAGSFVREAKRGDVTIDRKGDIVPARHP